jgi:schlafen family protein
MSALHAYYSATTDDFASALPTLILGELLQHTEFDAELTQRNAWIEQIRVLRAALAGIDGTVFLEFIVPRIGSRVDAVLVSGPVLFIIEFKVGASEYTRDDRNQVWDYALDLKYFHQGSHGVPIVPILVSTRASRSEVTFAQPSSDGVYPPVGCNGDGLVQLIRDGLRLVAGEAIDAVAWAKSPYRPTPTIVEAARALYSRHSVDDISRHDAGARNLTITSQRIEQLIEDARNTRTKIIVFVTGVPGAGKTLVGLNIATKKYERSLDTHAVFLSGNDPLVAVLREALIRDAARRMVGQPKEMKRPEIRHEVKAFIQNVHHFRDAGLRDDGPDLPANFRTS